MREQQNKTGILRIEPLDGGFAPSTDLTALRRGLSAVIASCDGGTIAECRIVEALGPIEPTAF